MNAKAFHKILAEAHEALADRRLSDALALTQAIAKDTSSEQLLPRLEALGNDYDALLRFKLSGQQDDNLNRQLNDLFCRLIELLQSCRRQWQSEHKQTSYGRIISQMDDLTPSDIADQLHRTVLVSDSEQAFYNAADAAFTLALHLPIPKSDIPTLTQAMQHTNSFCRKLMASAFLVGNLFCYERSKVLLLLRLGAIAKDTQDEALEARVMVGLAITYICYLPAFTYDLPLTEQLRAYFASASIRPKLPELCRAMTISSLTDSVGQDLDDLMPALMEAIEKQNPWIHEAPTKDGMKAWSKPIKLHGKQGERWMRLLSKQAQKVESLRQAGFDVNSHSMTRLKSFSFFTHIAHWFYPFTEQVPLVQQLHQTDERLNVLTTGIMRNNAFCESDCYSFISMMAYTQDMNPMSQIMDETTLGAMSEMFGDTSELPQLPSMIDYCQSFHRFLTNYADELPLIDPFSLSEPSLLPLLPLFSELYTEHSDITESVEALIRMGAAKEALILLETMQDRNGVNASLLRQKGFALMHLQMYARAAGAFQQAQLLDDDDSLLQLTAQCMEAQGRWEEALGMLRNLETSMGFNASIAEEEASCLIHLERWDEAADRLFQVEFEGQATDNTRRSIAWCSLHQGRYDRAIAYYTGLTEQRRKAWEDVLNLAHALWLNGQMAEAKATYSSYVKLFNRSKKKHHFSNWTEPIREDFHNLLHKHFSDLDLGLMLDAIERLPQESS